MERRNLGRLMAFSADPWRVRQEGHLTGRALEPSSKADAAGSRGGVPGATAVSRATAGNGATMDLFIETRGLTKQFAGFIAVQGVNLRVRRGSIHALIGPNGAGRVRCGLIRPIRVRRSQAG
jgi:hypothetical protein